MKRFCWDYFGPMGSGTAVHFQRHLDAFVIDMKLEGCTTGTSQDGPMEGTCWCDAPGEAGEIITERLKPHRVLVTAED